MTRTLAALIFGFSLAGSAFANAGLAAIAGTEEKDLCTLPDGPITPSPLAMRYKQLRIELSKSPFGSPIKMTSESGDGVVNGDVYALLEIPFPELNEALTKPARWCELAIMHVNIKACTYRDDEVQFFVGRKYYQPPETASPIRYQFSEPNKDEHDLNIQLTAASGPLGTSNYLIGVSATPIDNQHSFIHFTYRYQYGFMANLAMNAYLATLGRHKVGFTVTDTNKQGEPVYIKGLQGVIERNAMRYLFAIQTLLETKNLPEDSRQSEQFTRWFDHIAKFPEQLMDLTRKQYLDNKKQEAANQKELQARGGLFGE